MIGYATRTGTKRVLLALKAADWGLLITPESHRPSTFTYGFRYAIDNGAWSAYQRAIPWPEAKFLKMVELYHEKSDWIVLPDLVAQGNKSLDWSESWVSRLPGRLLLAVQDGMDPLRVAELLPKIHGLFVGGTTAWKLATLPMWAQLVHAHGRYLHVARVNTTRRIIACGLAGADSFDGTSVTRYAVHLPKLDTSRKQGVFPLLKHGG